MIDTIILDYGGVVADHYCEPYQSQLAVLLQTSRKRVRELLSERSVQGRQYRLGHLSKIEFWSEIEQQSEQLSIDNDRSQELWAQTYIPNQAILSLLDHLKNGLGMQTGIIMNTDEWRYRFTLEHCRLDDRVSHIVPSFSAKAIKPEKAIYEMMLDRCGRDLRPDLALYIDDRQSHVDAAEACGMRGYRYVNAGELTVFLESVDLLPFEIR